MFPLIIFPDIEDWASRWLYEQIRARSFCWAKKLNFDNVIPRNSERAPYLVVVSRDGGSTLNAWTIHAFA